MKRTLLAALLVLGCLLVAPAYASGDTTITGTLLAHNADSIVVRTVEGERTFAINDVTTMPADLALDSQVTVTYREANGMTIPIRARIGSWLAVAGSASAAGAAAGSSGAGAVASAGPVPAGAGGGTGADELATAADAAVRVPARALVAATGSMAGSTCDAIVMPSASR